MTGDWTPERVERLEGYWSRRWSATQIGIEMGISRNAVLGKVHRLGLSGRALVWSATERARRKAVSDAKRNARKVVMRQIPIAAPAEPVQPEIPVLSAGAPVPQNITLLDLAAEECRWPVTEHPPHFFCGQPTLGDASYCGYHFHRATDRSHDREAAMGPGPQGAPNWNVPRRTVADLTRAKER